MWYRIHAELGLSPTPLTYDMLVRAVDERMGEAEDLDWKRELPPEVEKKQWEFAKDVAAMANTRGGLIVYGVREHEGDGNHAAGLTDVPNGERDLQALRSHAHRYIRPLVDGLVIEAIDDPDGTGPGLIAVSVPSSPDAPHVIGEKNRMGVPYRYGTDTNWMSESELERAYRDRFTRRADDRTALTALIDGLRPEIDLSKGVWVAVATRPVAPLPLLAAPPSREQATETMQAALTVADGIFSWEQQGRPAVLQQLGFPPVENPRNGLRRWVIRSDHYATDPAQLVDWALVELHHDGSIALAVGLAGFVSPSTELGGSHKPWPVPYRLVDAVVVEAVALAAAHIRALGGVGTVLTRAVLLRDESTGRAPLVAVNNRLGHMLVEGEYRLVLGTRAVREPTAVETSFTAQDDDAALRQAARQLADDLDQQFGIRNSSIPG
ncbi:MULTISPECIES: helix-turn-helix domain-containing protein [Actinosynnema]|uniref:AlbA family DNA-binding domain-containing protein n=1 Tax=Actinosynnema TaxID=40566 RepID=UPI0020A27A6D|nr:ATP-binding protein [Actinosynnema pretiosum]MCP2099928.1 putative DNA-binding domain-containing protein [Actinosynnema pretiosum]